MSALSEALTDELASSSSSSEAFAYWLFPFQRFFPSSLEISDVIGTSGILRTAAADVDGCSDLTGVTILWMPWAISCSTVLQIFCSVESLPSFSPQILIGEVIIQSLFIFPSTDLQMIMNTYTVNCWNIKLLEYFTKC